MPTASASTRSTTAPSTSRPTPPGACARLRVGDHRCRCRDDAVPALRITGVADQGAVLRVLPMREVSSTEREITARVGDETEDRDRVFHEVLTLVDIDPDDITGPGSTRRRYSGWRLRGKPRSVTSTSASRQPATRMR